MLRGANEKMKHKRKSVQQREEWKVKWENKKKTFLYFLRLCSQPKLRRTHIRAHNLRVSVASWRQTAATRQLRQHCGTLAALLEIIKMFALYSASKRKSLCMCVCVWMLAGWINAWLCVCVLVHRWQLTKNVRSCIANWLHIYAYAFIHITTNMHPYIHYTHIHA